MSHMRYPNSTAVMGCRNSAVGALSERPLSELNSCLHGHSRHPLRHILRTLIQLWHRLERLAANERSIVMSAWSFVGSNSVNWLWTNGDDIAFCEGKYVDAPEIEDYPHPNCRIEYGVISSEYNGDVIAWLNNIDAYRETLQQMRERCNVR